MYAWLWHHLPGSTPIRVILVVCVALIVVAVLFLWVFPWMESVIEFDNTQVPQAVGLGDQQ